MPSSIHSITEFFYALDELKLVNRKSYVTGAARYENSAEHSWHLAVSCWAMAEYLPYEYNQDKLIKLAQTNIKSFTTLVKSTRAIHFYIPINAKTLMKKNAKVWSYCKTTKVTPSMIY